MLRLTSLNRRRALVLGATAAAVAAAATVTATAAPAPALDNRRYPGYAPRDWAEPFSRFMTEHTAPPQEAVTAACSGGPTVTDRIPDFADWTEDLAPTGYSAVETGYGYTAAGGVWVAVRTEMPRATPAMWDWWFGWHSSDSARYKLWHPDAHLFSELHTDTSAATMSDRARYVGNISYVDEYIGPGLQQLAIAFHDPAAHGFTVPADHTVILGRVGSSIAPIDLGWLAHQVRPLPGGGSEMRSRFYLGVYGVHIPAPSPIARAIERGATPDVNDLVPDLDMARELLLHCGQEMNHLAQFLPELHAQFHGTP